MDPIISWDAEVPDFTECFKTLLCILLPSLISVILILCDTVLSFKLKNTLPHPWTLLTVIKMLITITLILLSIIEFGFSLFEIIYKSIYLVSLLPSVCKIVVNSLVLFRIIRHRFLGVKVSNILFLLWFIQTVCGLILHRSSVISAFYKGLPPIRVDQFIINMIYYPLIYCQFILSMFSVKMPLEDKSAFETETFFLFSMYTWLDGIIFKGTRKKLTSADLTALPSKLKARYLWLKFQREWKKSYTNEDNFHGAEIEISSAPCCKGHKLTSTIISAFPTWILCHFLHNILFNFVQFLPPIFLGFLLEILYESKHPWMPYLLCGILALSLVLTHCVANVATIYAVMSALQVKSALMSAVYRKALAMSCTTKQLYSSGEMVNLMSVDVENVHQFFRFSSLIIEVPLKLCIATFFLWNNLGISFLSGVAVMLLIVPLSFINGRILSTLQHKQMIVKDERLKIMGEIIHGIKVLKLYAWEIPFMKLINTIRQKEVSYIRKALLCYAFSSFSFGCTPLLIAIASFATFVFIDANNTLDVKTVFVTLNILLIIRYTLFRISDMISRFTKGNTSLTRLRKFLSSEEREMSVVGLEPDEGKIISMRNAVFSWNVNSEPELKNINFHANEGSLTAIVGSVGSGKSSLLSALVGDMHKISGSIDLKGTLAYVPQQAWILNRTFKENIVFNKSFNLEKYRSTLQCCCLLPDISQLPAADQTEIGEKGINLSGGQKQRISLARAVYQDADVYLLDDPLSAVDAHVGKDLFENVISNSGALAHKTRILVTHNISILPFVDMIIVMEKGKIKESGTYEDLKGSSGSFLDFIQKQNKEQTHDNPEQQVTEGSDGCDKTNQTSNFVNEASFLQALSEHQNGTLIEEEKYEVGQVKWITYYNYLKNSKFYFLVPSIFSYMVYQVFEIFLTYSLSTWSPDDADSEKIGSKSSKYDHLYVILIWGVLQILSVVSANSFLALAAGEASQKYQESLIDCLLKCPLSFFDTTPHGRIMNRCSNDLNDIDNSMPINFDCFLVCVVQSAGIFILIGVVIPVFLIGLIPIVIILYITQKCFLMSSRQMKRLESTSKSPIYSHFKETVQGISSIYSYDVVEDFIESFERKTNASVACYYHWILTSEWLCMRITFFAVIIILTSSILCVQNRFILDPSTVGLVLIYCMTMTSALKFLIINGTALENSSISLERIDEYSNLTPEAPWEKIQKPPEAWPEAGSIKFQNYSTCYRKGLPLVLKKLNFEIPSGKKVGIVGRTGAGKSSLTLALFRILEPCEGSIIIDNIDISSIGLHDLRSKLTIIPQDPMLFIGTVRLNLDPNGQYTDDAIWSTLEKTHLKEYFKSSSKGLDFEISENGENLSAGQKQLICLARSMLRSSKILVLDEATATVDTKTDSLIQDTIRSSFKDCTVITIAHRLNTVLDNDIIFVMDNAEVIESGKPSELLNSDSVFSSMMSDASFSKS